MTKKKRKQKNQKGTSPSGAVIAMADLINRSRTLGIEADKLCKCKNKHEDKPPEKRGEKKPNGKAGGGTEGQNRGPEGHKEK